MDSKKTLENQDACAGLAAATGSEVCAICKWTNVGLLNLGEPGSPVMVCHGCCKRMHDTLRKISEPWLQTESAGASFRRRMAADALNGINPPNDKSSAMSDYVTPPCEQESCVRCGKYGPDCQCPSELAASRGSEARAETCPQCGASVVQTNLGGGKTDDYCEECGWPDENRGAEPVPTNAEVSEQPPSATPADTKNI